MVMIWFVRFVNVLLFLLFTSYLPDIRAECPRKKIQGNIDQNKIRRSEGAPAVTPHETWISCTYIFNDRSGYNDVAIVLNEIAHRLKREILINLKIEKIDCAEKKQEKCMEYSMEEPFHWLIVDDSLILSSFFIANYLIANMNL
ncbi:unnamed protein product [Thelazia callipaeda]|uniref:Glycosyltransferase 2-like domain-containing protein n=1 Tax=Thelazia callipaeda TaxID=103827 RepID=A0A0N5DC92_THECL|nr:unnamed protein product [Thelazia callipaeda]